MHSSESNSKVIKVTQKLISNFIDMVLHDSNRSRGTMVHRMKHFYKKAKLGNETYDHWTINQEIAID